jgi:4-amino-4-deoxy-L-arabinose transferase-like glycosyltransferase
MNHLKTKLINNLPNVLFVLFLIVCGLIKYFYDFEKKALFEADQVYLIEQAQKILNGNLTLIGAPTSAGNMFIGPFYNYFTAIFLKMLKFSPYTIEAISSFWGILTPIVIYLVVQKIFDKKTAVFTSIFSLFSFKFLAREDIPPLLFPLPTLSILIFYLLTRLNKNPKYLIITSILIGASLHLHFSGLFFLIFLIFYFIFKKPKVSKTAIFTSIIIFFIFLLPLFLFDLRHNFLISRNFLTFLVSQRAPSTLSFFQRINKPFLIDYEYLRNIFISLPMFLVTLFFLFLAVFFLELLSNKKLNFQLFIWILMPPTLFIFYEGLIIQYYFIIQLPIVFILFGFAIKKIILHKNNPHQMILKTIAIFILTMFISGNIKYWQSYYSRKSLYYKIKALRFIIKESRGVPIYLSHTIYYPFNFGYFYLEDYLKINKKDDKNLPIYTIIQPYNWNGINSQYIFGDIGVNLPE